MARLVPNEFSVVHKISGAVSISPARRRSPWYRQPNLAFMKRPANRQTAILPSVAVCADTISSRGADNVASAEAIRRIFTPSTINQGIARRRSRNGDIREAAHRRQIIIEPFGNVGVCPISTKACTALLYQTSARYSDDGGQQKAPYRRPNAWQSYKTYHFCPHRIDIIAKLRASNIETRGRFDYHHRATFSRSSTSPRNHRRHVIGH